MANPSSAAAAPCNFTAIVTPIAGQGGGGSVGNLRGVEVTSVTSPTFSPIVKPIDIEGSDYASSITDRKTAPVDKRVVVDSVNLSDIVEDDMNCAVSLVDEKIKPPRYNTSNHWTYDNRARPPDYDSVGQAVIAKHWMGKLKNDSRSFTLNANMMEKIRQIHRAFCLTGNLSKSFREEIADLCKRKDGKEFGNMLKEDNYFVRTDYTSLKYGMHGNKIYKLPDEVLESIVSSPRSHCPLGDVDKEESLTLYLIPWRDIDPDFEFRVFVNNNEVTAISQQNIYRKNEALCKLSNDERAKKINNLVQSIVDYHASNVKNAVTNVDSYVMDLVVNSSDGESVYFIELNPFGKDYTSGAAAYSWTEDADKVYGKEQNTVHFRYVI